MKILIAETRADDLNPLTRMLELDGHEVNCANTWKDALALFTEQPPDLVLLNPALPGADRHGCAIELKRLRPNRFIPVILFASVADPVTLARFMESKADDFIDPPYDHYVLKAKIAGFERVEEIYRRLEKFRNTTEQEINLAKHMFDAVINRKSQEDNRHVQHWSLAAGHFSGDLLIFERTPDNTLHIMLGDFTGHGLVAAIGALPAADIFFEMTKKGAGISDIAAEINRKLHRLLPIGRFCAAGLLAISPRTNRVEAWNGGLPAILLVNGQGKIVHRLSPAKLPLGIVDAENFDSSTAIVATEDACHAILYSDGLVEAQNAEGREFGGHGLAAALNTACAGDSLIEHIKASVIGFLDGLEPHDDISLLALNLESLA